ncbi:DUF5686 and carboxypeptidase regulatory-like domain-containing protein [Psychroserpens ponticola]|uniref:DUF5686 and carboxypeptidase regulatory-like domain-containing protein n=1 Tax=Psychroserpens ponticola TaxID=2932268 RepID=A0ABY7RUK2_9FLAO|nr:DUF5686 and carboxypeptidase regulatory-like domain-containing protein [Psychroserpens ponticola]WCO00493.1 DUF5686 and carboxypeptidase regulatory-like domain-containing protein [Psychroserpens ponticola]
MKKIRLTTLTLLYAFVSFSQIKGTVADTNSKPLPFVNIFIENTYKGTTSNEEGIYELNISKPDTYTVVFQFLGYKTVKKTVTIESFPFNLDAVLADEEISLNEVVVTAGENPANIIIRQAIAKRKENLEKIKSYKADFYSRGLIRIKDAPEKILGQEVGDLGGGLDSTRSGVIYLSETISKLEFLRPNKLKEKIVASKVSGDDKGFSFNNAIDVEFDLYYNTIELGNQIISPIANNAFGYYRYTLEGVFYDDRGHLINKIKATPRRKNDPVFEGFIYIVEDQWTIYAAELDITGIQARLPAVDKVKITQNFAYSEQGNLWTKISQNIDFKYGLFGIKGDGRFTAVYSNYVINPGLTRKDFSREIVSFADEANKKDSTFWTAVRPVPLTDEEITDYIKKDSIQIVKDSKVYKDSVDQVNNKFKFSNIIGGYTYSNTYENWRAGITSPIEAISFNTVQGWNGNVGGFYTKSFDDYKRYFSVNGNINYGFSDHRLRGTLSTTYKFNDTSRPFLTVSGGIEAAQFNASNPISRFENTIASLYFEDNYMKLYDRSFVEANFSEELFNGFRFYTTLSYERRKALFNTSEQVFFPEDDDVYTSNNPLSESAYGIAPFETHNIVKLNVLARINFGQEYLSYPDSKYNITKDKNPTVLLGYEKGLGATNDDYNFDQVKARVYQSFNVSNKGRFSYNIRAGKFFNADDISFVDFQHFNGNQIHFSQQGNYTDVFNNLGYYDLSTNDSYLEMHAEHDFNGFILSRIPLLKKLNFNLVVGAHALATPNNKPYQEYTIGLDNIGWGKWRFLRVDYVRSYQSGFVSDAVLFGLKFF